LQLGPIDVQPSPIRHASLEHVTSSSHESLPIQATLHAHDSPQDTRLHESLPPQITVHSPLPQTTFLQLVLPVHSTRHAPVGGQAIASHDLVAMQRMTHTPAMHVPGQLAPQPDGGGASTGGVLGGASARLASVVLASDGFASVVTVTSNAVAACPHCSVESGGTHQPSERHTCDGAHSLVLAHCTVHGR